MISGEKGRKEDEWENTGSKVRQHDFPPRDPNKLTGFGIKLK